MFFDDSLKGLKKELKAAGADVSFVKGWQKKYDKLKKQYPVLESQYIKAKTDLEAVMLCLNKLEQLLIGVKDASDFGLIKGRLSEIAKELKKYQNSFQQEFLIGKEDQEFHSTFSAILTLCGKDLKEKQDRLILQSEVENLMAITKEALEKMWPDFREMAYFYLEHTDEEILDLPHTDKIQFVKKMYQDEFYNPMKQVIEAALGNERVKHVMEVELWT